MSTATVERRMGSQRFARGIMMRLRPCAGMRHGQLDDELRAFAAAFAVRHDASAVHLDDVADDRESEAKAAVGARARRFRLTKSLEDMRQKAGIDSLSGIGDRDLRRVADALEANRDCAAAVSALCRAR